ncbi:hypothetical protein HYFRA_00003979 [Hymenoscyphus fraxineus]|uniref:NmrA-like domain-containing protein n=1 Tax=Hymenoscyphus fraxineus TaxID=746836 RepID=A0A9N9KMB2_9HELO|nr:hypothetical protein HYFRA_00003979 [Hymenoscyphus fraxineus]
MSSSTTKATILLLGGTGKISSRIAPLLSEANYSVLQASRSGKASPNIPNCTGVKFDWDDEKTYDSPFSSGSNKISAVFLVAPPFIDALPPMKSFIERAKSHGVSRFVLLSASILEVGDGPAMGEVAGYVKGLGTEWAVLRPSWFMEDFSEMQHVVSIRDNSQIITAAGDGKLPFVSADDIAAVAFHALTDEKAHNTDHLILGPDLWTYGEVAGLLSKFLNRTVTHVSISEQELAGAMKGFGIESRYADMLAELDTFVKEGREELIFEKGKGVVEDITGKKARGLEEYVKDCIERKVWV